MLAQYAIVAVIVIACSAYAAWTLMPAAARRGLATALLRLPLPAALAVALQRHTVASSGCGCDGCDQGSAKVAAKNAPAAVQPIRFHPRPPR